jgi:hypothetical protein
LNSVIIVVLGLLSSGITLTNFGNGIYASEQQSFTALMTGLQVIPPVDTSGTGSVTFQKETNNISYSLNVLDVCGITNIQLHYGERGEEGPSIANLYQSKNGLNLFNNDDDLFDSDKNILNSNNDFVIEVSSVQKSCNLSYSGRFDESALQGQFKDGTIDGLTNGMANNNTYIVVNSEQHPDGEIRGQILFKVPN